MNQEEKLFCPTCGVLEKDKDGNYIHPERDRESAEMLKNGFSTNYTPTSEEEKFIEEFKEKLKEVYCVQERNYYFEDIDFEASEFLFDFIRKAYRAGKLAGFEMCEGLVPQKLEEDIDDTLIECTRKKCN